jgi:hydroxymethylpyrimidine/phosphomethylpyrimidine kinase
LQADILTLAALGAHPLCAVTALTVQDTAGVVRVAPTPAELVRQQAETVLADIPVAAFKTGVLGSAENARAAAEVMAAFPDIPLVLDPVLASGRGDALADAGLRAVLRERLLPRATLITPNLPEAYRLLESEAPAAPEEPVALVSTALATKLMALGARHVLITGTHAPTEAVINRLYGARGLIGENRWPRLPESYHGSGCTLASAIAAHLALGHSLEEAVNLGEAYAWQTLAHGFKPGRGQWLPNRLFRHA